MISIVCPATAAQGWLQGQLKQMQVRYPEICPIISTDETARFVDDLDVEIAITAGSLHQEDSVEKLLLKDDLIFVGVSDMVEKLVALPKEKHPEMVPMMFHENALSYEKTDIFLRAHFSMFRKSAIYDDQRLLLDASKRGMGLALVSSLLVYEDLKNGTLVHVPDYPVFPLPYIYMTKMRDPYRPELIEKVWSFLCAAARQE